MDKEKSKEENTSKFGEQVCSEFAWLPLDKQKENANKLSKITKSKKREHKINVEKS